MVYKRFNRKKMTGANDPNWNRGTWYVRQRVAGKLIHKAIPEARNKQDATAAAIKIVEDAMLAAGVSPSLAAIEASARLRRTPPKHRFIYLIESRGFHKIGMASDVARRVKALADGAKPSKVELIHAREVPNARKAEAALHARFFPYQVVGEWFKFEPEQIPEVMQAMDYLPYFDICL